MSVAIDGSGDVAGPVKGAAAVDNVNESLRENGKIARCAGNLVPIGNSRWIPVAGGLPGWPVAGKPALIMVELDLDVRRPSRNRPGIVELAASVAGQ